ncbi:PAS domain-containing sensor histidine kinase [Rickettsiella endosymbiont of Dermanyssus gallinae]|uniref:PAS domain-containing sensor histidine kinase n=1 Tax=Rickettsiella endosymbiont of Dermanyssus gallinae TaxID=2856608 RepID=UPI001C528564|nr:PAS domain-containing sensor histidine kinase [Rickettsiella endosymbiont of Dermanyssus gallinae]
MSKDQKINYFKQLLESIPGNAYLKDIKGHYLDCNDQHLKVVRVNTREEILGKTDKELYPQAIAESIIQLDKKLMTEQKECISQEVAVDDDGKEIIYSVKKRPWYDEQGKVAGIIGVGEDVTKLKKAEDKIYELDSIIAQLPGNVYWFSNDFIYLGCNENSARTLGMERSETVGKDFSELMRRIKNVDKKVINSMVEDGKQVIETNIPKLNIEEPPFVGPEGQRLYWVANKVPLKNRKGETVGVIGISTEITKLKEAQQKAEAANQAKTEFLENMRHDIRTPLSGIVGCAHLIQMQSNNPKKVNEYAVDLIQSSDALLEFLNKILESIKVATGEIPLLKQRFDLHKELERIIRLNKPQAEVKHLKLHLDYDKTIPSYLLGDPVRIQNIALELVTNALKYTDKGEIKVSARLIKNEKREVIIELRVSDTGMGIPRDKHQEVYTRFTRLIPSYKGIYPGTGLGLSVVKQYIDDLNGEIRIESEVGKGTGTTFTCLIPLQESLSVADGSKTDESPSFANDIHHIATKKPTKASELQEIPVTTGSRVLVVEDNPIAARVAKGVLLALNCQIDIASNGKTALTLIEKNHYRLILMDIGLPGEDGCDVTRRIRLKQWQSNPSVPIIGLTAHIDEEKKKSCLANGMNAIYTKPLTPEKASGILNAFLSHSQAPAILKEKRDESSDNNNLQSLPLLDKKRALNLLGSEKTLHELLELLESSLIKEIAELKQHHQDKDWQSIGKLAHKWKGGASYCGASRLEQVCKEIQMVLRSESPEKPEMLYQTLLQVAEETKEAAKQAFS